jgi:pimeloyl-ACP methyl ester carboxylesterase
VTSKERITMSAEAMKSSVARKRGLLFHVRRGVKWIGILLIAAILIGAGFQAAASEADRRNFAPPGQIVNVDGQAMHIRCSGQGSPTVILEAGAYSFSAEWYWVQQQLEQTNRVCSYDRAGNGWSEAVEGPRDGLTLVHELHSLLRQAGIAAPFVMVGHSLGGVLAPIYAAQYPDDILGLVLVDSAVPRQWEDRAQFEQYLTAFPSPYMVMSALMRVGALRLILPGELQGYGYPPEVTAQLTAFKATPQGVDTWNAEARLAQWDLGQQLSAATGLGDLPIVVLWASNPGFVTAEDRAILAQIWAKLPTFSDNSVVRIVDGADHGSIVGGEQYALQVTDAVLDVVASARTGDRLSQ